MAVMYSSTRNKNEKVTASQAILKGLANDGVGAVSLAGFGKRAI